MLLLAALPPECDAMEIKVWLPGSYIWLTGAPFIGVFPPGSATNVMLVEGNLEPGSVLGSD